ncbi:hypothetical protein L6164_007514 [Bauhinia variegata]|uniref:Uncharacterized protein n=1 Tax=Bauhinia variegata TaxID=167791 RepID=A0ACB9PDP5_BAUVA|nr:hypothetical protein L6164_007514 [Bauhinia variegata]
MTKKPKRMKQFGPTNFSPFAFGDHEHIEINPPSIFNSPHISPSQKSNRDKATIFSTKKNAPSSGFSSFSLKVFLGEGAAALELM